jgi:heme/copper-type cytochrome/quinol oxidase subunit 1
MKNLLKYFFIPVGLFALIAIVIIAVGIVINVIQADSTLDIPVHDTYFVIAPFHQAIICAIPFIFFSLIYWAYPKITRRKLYLQLTLIHLLASVFSILVMFFFPGILHSIVDINTTVHIALYILLIAQAIFVLNLILSAFRQPFK